MPVWQRPEIQEVLFTQKSECTTRRIKQDAGFTEKNNITRIDHTS